MKKWRFLLIPVVLSLLYLLQYPPRSEKKTVFDIEVNPIALKNEENNLLQRLALTEQQRQLIRRSRDHFRQDKARLDSKINLEKTELENEIDEDEPSLGRLEGHCQKIGALYGQKLRIAIHRRLEVERRILTPQQWVRLQDLEDEAPENPAIHLASSR